MDEWFCPECAGPGAAAPPAGSAASSLTAPPKAGAVRASVKWGGSWGPGFGPAGLEALADSGPGSPFLHDADPVTEEEVSLLLVDVVPTASRLRPHAGRIRAIARTRQSERVRATVNRNRMSTARTFQVGAPSKCGALSPASGVCLWGCPWVGSGGEDGGAATPSSQSRRLASLPTF